VHPVELGGVDVGSSIVLPATLMAALLTRTSRPPNRATTSSISWGASVASAWSDRKAAACTPLSSSSLTTAAALTAEAT
jgi:hypothetical protein